MRGALVKVYQQVKTGALKDAQGVIARELPSATAVPELRFVEAAPLH